MLRTISYAVLHIIYIQQERSHQQTGIKSQQTERLVGLTERRRRYRQNIAQREDFPACTAYLQDRGYHRLCIESIEAMLAFLLNNMPGQKE